MEEYKVTEKDLVGQIKDFPIEVVQKMVDCQVEQGYKADVTAFQICKKYGFLWCDSEDGTEFLESVIVDMNFDVFFKKYPKHQVTIQKDMETNKIILNGITLPKDTEVKVSVEDGTTILTSQKQEEKEPEFKDGDIIFLTHKNKKNYIAIFESYNDKSITVHGCIDSENNVFLSDGNGFFFKKGISSIRCATEYEILKFNKEFAEQKHLKWNAEEFKFEPIRWRAEKGGKFWFITSNGVVDYAIDDYKPISDLCFNSRNYFQTEELANKALPLWQDFFKNLSL